MAKKQPSNADLLDEIQRLRDEVQRLSARPITIREEHHHYPQVRPYVWPNTGITWTSNTGCLPAAASSSPTA